MNQDTPIFPLSAESDFRDQAAGLAIAAWLMGGPDGDGQPDENDAELPRLPSGAGGCRPAIGEKQLCRHGHDPKIPPRHH